jgi:hypothetical protein
MNLGERETMIETILTALENSTPALRQRYLDRIRSVGTAEARAIEERLVDLIEHDQELARA